MRKERQGYTLFEIVVVMAIILVGAAIAIPSIRGMMGDTPVKAGADQLKSRLAEAKAKAIEEGKPYRFSVSDKNGAGFRVAPDDDFDGPNGMDDILPEGVSFGDGASVVFLPDGTATSDLDLPLNGKGSAPVTLKLNKTTGAVNLQR